MHNTEIAKQDLHTFYRNNQYGWMGSLILFFTLLFIMQVPFTPLLIMHLALFLPYLAFHITNNMMFKQAFNEAGFNIKIWQRSAAFISAYLGLLIGSLPVKYLDLDSPTTTYIICAILILYAFGFSMVSATCKRVHLVWSITSILPITFLLLLTDNFAYNILAAMILLAGISVGMMMAIRQRSIHMNQ